MPWIVKFILIIIIIMDHDPEQYLRFFISFKYSHFFHNFFFYFFVFNLALFIFYSRIENEICILNSQSQPWITNAHGGARYCTLSQSYLSIYIYIYIYITEVSEALVIFHVSIILKKKKKQKNKTNKKT